MSDKLVEVSAILFGQCGISQCTPTAKAIEVWQLVVWSTLGHGLGRMDDGLSSHMNFWSAQIFVGMG
jgi:hypothetical protein